MRMERFYWLYLKIKNGFYPSKDDYFYKFGKSLSTFKRDIEYFRERLLAPIEYDRERNGYYFTDESYEIPLCWFSTAQMLMIMGLCRQIEFMSMDDAGEIREFRERIERLIDPEKITDIRRLVSFENEGWHLFHDEHMETVMEALLERRCVRMTYHAAHTDRTTTRIVEPYRLHSYKGDWHLAGYCRLREEARWFILGRIRELVILDEVFQEYRFDADRFLNGSFGIYRGEAARRVVLRFNPRMTPYLRDQVWHKDQVMEPRKDGGVDLTLKVTHLTEIRMKVLKYGPEVEVLEPPELRRQVAEAAAEIVKKYGKK